MESSQRSSHLQGAAIQGVEWVAPLAPSAFPQFIVGGNRIFTIHVHRLSQMVTCWRLGSASTSVSWSTLLAHYSTKMRHFVNAGRSACAGLPRPAAAGIRFRGRAGAADSRAKPLSETTRGAFCTPPRSRSEGVALGISQPIRPLNHLYR
jgi:hypothetical protein